MNRTEAIDSVEPSVVQIRFLANDISEDWSEEQAEWTTPEQDHYMHPLGTGILINRDAFVITAHHVLQGGKEMTEQFKAGLIRLQAGLAIPNTPNVRGTFNVTEFEVIAEDQNNDLALLRLKQNPFAGEVPSVGKPLGVDLQSHVGVVTINPSRPRHGQEVAVSGYPLAIPVLITTGGWVASSWSFNTKEVPYREAPEYTVPYTADVYLLDVQVNPGNSGGPVYLLEDGSVIGVCVATRVAPGLGNAGITVTVPAEYVINLLDQNGVSWTGSSGYTSGT